MGRVSDAKQRLMEAIAELIWTGSYGTTTIDQICEKAGVKKGSFYYFFKSKADLAEAAIEVEWTKYRRSEEHTSELQSLAYLVCRLLLEKKKKKKKYQD